jgi:hypothetical protein
MKLAALPLLLVVLCPSVVLAQTTDDEEVEMGDDPLAGESSDFVDLDGTAENPAAPDTEFGRRPAAEVTAAAPAVPGEYPIERVLRPITLPERMTEVSLTLPNTFNPYVQSFVLGGQHGVTEEIQAGLRYGIGTFVASDGDSEFFAGKAFALDVRYQIFSWLAGQLSLPLLVDPFAMGVTLGAPFQFTFFDRLRLYGGGDLLTLSVSRFAPQVDNAAHNAAFVALDETGTALPSGHLFISGGAIYQHQPHIAFDARVGVYTVFKSLNDSSSTDPLLFDVGATYSTSNKVDVGARIGFADLNDAGGSFGLHLLAALRL